MRLLLFALPGVASAFLSWVLTPLARRIAIRLGAVDRPAARKVHLVPTPRLGGLAVVTSAMLVLSVVVTTTELIDRRSLWLAVGLGLVPILLVSIADDVKRVPAGRKFLGHLAGALVATAFGVTLGDSVHLFGLELHTGIFAYPISVLWLIGVTNAFNLVDGLDGLSAGLALISAGGLVAVFLVVGESGMALSALIVAGALIGFLPHNLYPAKVFLGDTGATAIGFVLGCLTLRGGSTMSAGFATLLPVIILGLPLTDTVLSVARRAISHNRTSGSGGVFDADRRHIHHRLLERVGHQRAVLTLYAVGLGLALASLLSITLTAQKNGFLLLALLTGGFIGVARLGYQEFALVKSGFVLRFYDAPVLKRSLFVVFLDLFFVAVAICVAIVLRYDDWRLVQNRGLAVSMMATLGPITVFAMWAMGVYRGSWRLASIHDVLRISTSVAASSIVGFVGIVIVVGLNPPLSLFLIYALVKLALANGSRLSYRVLAATKLRAGAEGANVLIYGAGAGGAKAVCEILSNPDLGLQPVGFIDDNPARTGRAVDGFPILGRLENLEECVRATAASIVLISTKKIPSDRLVVARNSCQHAGARLLRMDIRFEECSGLPVWTGQSTANLRASAELEELRLCRPRPER